MDKNILIVEPEATGHHMALYVRLIVSVARHRGLNIYILTTVEAISHPSFRLVKEAANNEISVYLMDGFKQTKRTDHFSLLLSQFHGFISISRRFRAITREIRPDYIYFVNLDFCDKIISLLGSPFGTHKFSGLMTTLTYHRNQMNIESVSHYSQVYKYLFRRLLKLHTLNKVSVIDESFSEFVHNNFINEYNKIYFVPDPGELHGQETKEQARLILGLTPDLFVILVYGSLTSKKGIRELVNGILSGKISNVLVMLVGNLGEDVEQLIQEPSLQTLKNAGRLQIHSGFFNLQQEYCFFRAADAVWVGYVGEYSGSSGVYYQAGSVGLPVIARQNGMLGWLVDRHANGVCCDPCEPNSVAAAIHLLIKDPGLRDRLGENGRTLAQMHTELKFCNAVEESIFCE